MKKKIHFILSGCVLVCLISCSGGKQPQGTAVPSESRMDSRMIRTHQDTVTLDSLATVYLEHLKAQNFEAALNMLSELAEDGSVIPLTEQSRVEQKTLFQSYPVINYTLDSLFLYSEDDTELRYTVTLFEKGAEDTRPNTAKFQLTPKRVNGIWKLLIKERIVVR